MIYAIIIILLIVLIKAIFSAADTSFTYINRAEIKQLSKTDKKAKKIRILMEDSNKFFGIIEVGVNMCELFASAVASITILEYLMDLLEKNNINSYLAMLISVIVVTVVLAYIMLVFGGVLPKRIARNNPKKTAFRLIPILWIVAKLNYPFEKLIDVSTNLFSKVFKINKEPEEKMTEKQLKMIIKEAKDEGVLEGVENRILLNTIKANNISVNKIVIPLEEACLINISDNLSQILNIITEDKYTRIPIYENEKNNIIGILNIKDIAINYAKDGISNKEQIKAIIKEPQYINQEEKIFNVFKKMQKERQIITIVCNKENIPVGLITMEDILEELVGKIFDEDDKEI